MKDLDYHRDCTTGLKKTHADLGVDIDVYARPPKPPSLHLREWRCPHSVVYWYQPSAMQVARWRHAGMAP